MGEPTATELILGRVEASEEGVKQAFANHEVRDQERFQVVDDKLVDLAAKVEHANGDIGVLKTKEEKRKDREEEKRRDEDRRMTRRDKIVVAVIASGATAVIGLVIHLATS